MEEKRVSFNDIADYIRQLAEVPQHLLTQEYIAGHFADRLEYTHGGCFGTFDRTAFLGRAEVSPRLVEEVEASVTK